MLGRSERPTAIFAASDTQALGVIGAARDIGLQVPGDLTVIGYDDIQAADPVGLTTIRQQLYESGRRGAEVLLAEIEPRSDHHRSSIGTRARGPGDNRAAEGGPWKTSRKISPRKRPNSRRSDHARRPITNVPGRRRPRRLAALAFATVLVAACAAAGAVSHIQPPAGRPAGRPIDRAGGQRLRRGAARRTELGTDPSKLNTYIETGFDLPSSCLKSLPSSTRTSPSTSSRISSRTLTATPRLLSGDNPPDLARLPLIVSS